MDPQIAAAVIGPILTAALAAAAVTIQEWRTRRASADRRHEALIQATSMVSFIDAWTTAHAKLAPEATTTDAQARPAQVARALGDLEHAYQAMSEAQAAAANAPASRTAADRVAALLLLRLQRTGAKVLRAVYYLLAMLGFVLTIASIATAAQSPQPSVAMTIAVAMMVTVICFAPAAVVYLLARLADRPAAFRPEQHDPVTGE